MILTDNNVRKYQNVSSFSNMTQNKEKLIFDEMTVY